MTDDSLPGARGGKAVSDRVWNRTTVTISCHNGKWKVAAFVTPDIPGLAITPNQPLFPGITFDFEPNGIFRITHRRSGLALLGTWSSQRRAERALAVWGGLADWTQGQRALKKLLLPLEGKSPIRELRKGRLPKSAALPRGGVPGKIV